MSTIQPSWDRKLSFQFQCRSIGNRVVYSPSTASIVWTLKTLLKKVFSSLKGTPTFLGCIDFSFAFRIQSFHVCLQDPDAGHYFYTVSRPPKTRRFSFFVRKISLPKGTPLPITIN